MRAYASDETSPVIDEFPIRVDTAHNQHLLAQTIEAQLSRMNRGQRPFQRRALSSARSSIHEEEDTSLDPRASGGAVSERSMNNGGRTSSATYQSSLGRCIVSPVPSLQRARAGALVITETPEFSRLGQTKLQEGVRNQDVNGDGRRDFRNYESPFSRRVKEKFRQVHTHSEESPREPWPSERAVELPSSVEDSSERNREPEIRGADLILFVAH